MNKIKKVTAINIILPFWLEWARKHIRLEIKVHKFPKMKGRKIDTIIMDEAAIWK